MRQEDGRQVEVVDTAGTSGTDASVNLAKHCLFRSSASTEEASAGFPYLSVAVAARPCPPDGDGLAVLRYALAHLDTASVFATCKLGESKNERDDDHAARLHGRPFLPMPRLSARQGTMSNDGRIIWFLGNPDLGKARPA
jgi:hypothetical protein